MRWAEVLIDYEWRYPVHERLLMALLCKIGDRTKSWRECLYMVGLWPERWPRPRLYPVPEIQPAQPLEPIGSLTGRVRYRDNWRGKLILQVEFNDSAWLGHSVHRFRGWRDATISDIYTGAFYGNMPSEIVRPIAGRMQPPNPLEPKD